MKPVAIESAYMMATTAIHQSGDISRDTPDLCVVFEDDGENYIGNWVCGYGFCNVKFPKATTRTLTPEEVEKYHGQVLMIGGGFGPTINIKNEDFRKHVVVTRKKDGKSYSGTLVGPVKVGRAIAMITDAGRTFHSSQVQKVDGDKVETLNSVYQIQYA